MTLDLSALLLILFLNYLPFIAVGFVIVFVIVGFVIIVRREARRENR
ncbi:hypothetical protein [Rathayibacter sp. SD072]|nr:hypothetical protein [Rathayibacter sp. SD072]MBO0984914.1 hypothetical protein [Rathayibacter sp. SD072]